MPIIGESPDMQQTNSQTNASAATTAQRKIKTAQTLKPGMKSGIMVRILEKGQFYLREFYLREVFTLPRAWGHPLGGSEKHASVMVCKNGVLSFRANRVQII